MMATRALHALRELSILTTSDVTAKPPRARRRKLTEAQKAELGRLYTETTTPLSEIKSRFGIAESSLYRLLQQRGVTLRGRGARTETPPAAAESPVTRRRGRRAMGTGTLRRQATNRVNGLARYRVSFVGVQVVEAVDILDALRQAQKFGATEVTQIERANR
jgi:transposase-like protein